MRRTFEILLAVASAVVFWSCSFEEEVELGFPAAVTFSEDGGEKIVTGTVDFSHAHIHDYKSGEDGDIVYREDDIDSEVYQWLRIEYIPQSTELKIIAEPTTTGKTRTLHIELFSTYKHDVIRVAQEG